MCALFYKLGSQGLPGSPKEGQFFRLHCSVVLWGGRNTANKYHWRVWAVLAVSGPHWVCPHSRCVCFTCRHCSGSCCLAGDLSKVGPGLCVLPRSKPLRFRFSGTPQRHRLSWLCVLSPSQVWTSHVSRCLASTWAMVPAWSQLGHVS